MRIIDGFHHDIAIFHENLQILPPNRLRCILQSYLNVRELTYTVLESRNILSENLYIL